MIFFWGELALLNDEPRAATVKAVSDVEVLSLSKKIFVSIIEASSSFEEQLKNMYFGLLIK